MKKSLLGVAVCLLISLPVLAALKVGDMAPDFSARGSLAGKEFDFSLQDALKKGPVVVYFFPSAYTKGCDLEAHTFAQEKDKFDAAGATIIGVSADKIDVLDKFSTADCQSKFALAADPELKVAKSYDSVLTKMLGYADRTSYVIAPNGKILYAYSAMDPDKHVENTLAAVEKWRAAHKG